ncbi:hypothetical protein WOLCODRAFT_24910 [Wolfiporia cocos MD-104 SS10]|uniref:F-box domain-containing protein n=1 Tax=Wolfiporia cocos (strain MD-104) TaxID=742152 RepID=A0A2H3JZS5_WOLCO|nr:hypothetical protein WOLCODRAFT_24910 [Wolfiporia cocos MD-104 SS10]
MILSAEESEVDSKKGDPHIRTCPMPRFRKNPRPLPGSNDMQIIGTMETSDCRHRFLPVLNPIGHGLHPHQATSRVPIEVWEHIINMLRDEPRALMACELVCKRWSKKCQYLLRRLTSMSILRNREEVVLWAKTIHAMHRHGNRVSRVHIRGSTEAAAKGRSLAHLGTFTAMLAGCLPSLRELFIKYGDWRAGAIPEAIFLHLTTFRAVTDLRLLDVTFPSITIFGRVVCALSNLRELKLENVSFTNPHVPSPTRRFTPPRLLSYIEIWWISSAILRALTTTTIAAQCQHLNLTSEVPLEALRSSALQGLLRLTGRSLSTLSPLRITQALLFLDKCDAEELIVDNVNLSWNPSLRCLKFHVDLNILHFDTVRSSRYDWIFQAISHATVVALEEVEISLWWILIEMNPTELHNELHKVMEGRRPQK